MTDYEKATIALVRIFSGHHETGKLMTIKEAQAIAQVCLEHILIPIGAQHYAARHDDKFPEDVFFQATETQ